MIALSMLWSMIVLVYEFGNGGLGRRWFIGDGLIYGEMKREDRDYSVCRKAVTIGIVTAQLLVCVTIGRRASNRVLYVAVIPRCWIWKTCSMRLF